MTWHSCYYDKLQVPYQIGGIDGRELPLIPRPFALVAKEHFSVHSKWVTTGVARVESEDYSPHET